jgi:hypothetical protein
MCDRHREPIIGYPIVVLRVLESGKVENCCSVIPGSEFRLISRSDFSSDGLLRKKRCRNFPNFVEM